MPRLQIYKLFIMLLLNSLLFAQTEETIISPDSTVSSQPVQPEIAELKLKFITIGLETEEMFRLASFYLTSKLYGKASEMYALYIEQMSRKQSSDPKEKSQLAYAHYNRALSLFSLKLYESSKIEFEAAYQSNPSLLDTLRMIGTIFFIKQDKDQALYYWKKYLTENTNTSPVRLKIENTVEKLESPDFEFEKKEELKKAETNNSLWPFLNPDTIPYPDAQYEKKRII